MKILPQSCQSPLLIVNPTPQAKIIVSQVGPQGPAGPEGPPGSAVKIKAGIVQDDDFYGTPMTYGVVFDTPFLNINYTININGADARFFTYENVTVNGFTINTNADDALTGDVSWFCIQVGEEG